MSSRYSADQQDLRTQLFSTTSTTRRIPNRTSSPYDPVSIPTAKHSESMLSSLESQNNEDVDVMGDKVAMLKNLGVKIGVEINKGIKLNDEITNSFEKGGVSLKNTYNHMVAMSKRAGITWKMWLLVFMIVGIWFFWIWLF
ncbi:Protein transport protein BET1 [Spathaspora sp. JA1]|nr:Protein transport protein BET1 [Spathaspora sp. JA1]